MNTISIIILCLLIIIIALIVAILIFVTLIGPKKILETLNNLLKINEMILTNKRQAMENSAMCGRTVKSLEIIEEHTNIIENILQNISSNFTNVKDVLSEKTENRRIEELKIEAQELNEIEPISVDIDDKTLLDDDFEEKNRENILIDRAKTQINIPFSDIEETKENAYSENEIKLDMEKLNEEINFADEQEKSKVKIVGEDMEREIAKKDGYNV